MIDLRVFAALGAVCFGATSAMAEDSALVGTWKGQYITGAQTTHSIALDIKSVDNGVIKGTVQRHTNARVPDVCNSGEYPVEGSVKGNTLRVRGQATLRGQECSYTLNGTVEGDKILAKVGQREFTMTK